MAILAMGTSKAMRQDAAFEILFEFFVYEERYWFFKFHLDAHETIHPAWVILVKYAARFLNDCAEILRILYKS